MTDFFVSYTGRDQEWAEWIAFVLEEEGYKTIIQAWDFRPGSNFVLEMQRAAAEAERTIMVLSPDYLKSAMAAPEWAGAFAQDPQGLQKRLVPVMVRACEPKGLLPTIVQIRIMDKIEEEARQAIISGVQKARAKPSKRPAYPGAPMTSEPKAFPGKAGEQPPQRSVLPTIQRPWTDIERRKFLKAGFQTIHDTFKQNLEQAMLEHADIDTDFTANGGTDFSAEIFVAGKSKSRGRIWIANEMGSDQIAVQEGTTSGNAMNEILTLSSDGSRTFQALLAMGTYGEERDFDTKHLSAEDAAAYLWARFVRPLSYG